jgi:hypothetical protein
MCCIPQVFEVKHQGGVIEAGPSLTVPSLAVPSIGACLILINIDYLFSSYFVRLGGMNRRLLGEVALSLRTLSSTNSSRSMLALGL